ncbi:oxidoreductase [Halorubellus sp. JP-L1]|uniref:ferredoxin--NADP reductase n=1 Tax=Halorubellus sp. JP-L1 TaxID=2715753 RepID=UPI00140D1582|nr:FAD-binding oxidoreductase [Halorubellus sp. JP-L1]NHN40758.1 oxidoreductase [Halorubellus sp. JP-L1]
MDVPEHLGHHEAAEELPLVTESAVVTAVEAMDRNRTADIENAVGRILDRNDASDWYRDPGRGADEGLRSERVDWDDLVGRATDAGFPDDDVDALADLAVRFQRPYPSLLRVRVRLDDDVDLSFAPGQYATVTFDGHPRPYSIASSPTADELEFCIRRVPGGRLTTDIFQYLDVGDEVTIRGPNGEMVLGAPSTRDLVFLATGTGVAPFASMIDYVYATDRHVVDGHERDVWLFLGAAYEDDLAYREAFRDYDRERDGFHFVPTLTRERRLTDWRGETEYVQRVLLKYVDDDAVDASALPARLAAYASADPAFDVDARIDPGNVDVYACGITAMVDQLVDATRAVGVPAERTQFEGFG